VGRATGVHGVDVYGAFDFEVIRDAVTRIPDEVLFGSATAAALAAALVFCGAMGKSAQFPLHVWLPDAMEGPTPVSALMHAATMVAAGVYMVVRAWFLFEHTAWAPTLLAWLGGITALLAASMAITQRDIKKVLAYSTLSQLGYMTMALGAGAYTGAMFHLTTHAFFKALLFLGAGSVIHACHHEQDMFRMGGLRRLMPATFRTFAIGTLALCGIFPLAGFWSKDEILGALLETDMVAGAPALWLLGTVVAGMTAFYMGRVWILVFAGSYRGDARPHESPRVMTLPLWILAAFSVVVGFVGIPGANRFEHFLHAWHGSGAPAVFHVPVAAISTLVALGGFALARAVYLRRPDPAEDPLPARLGPLWTLWDRLWFVEDLYAWLVARVQQGFARVCWFFERWVVIQAFVNGLSQGVRVGGDRLRRVQTGRLSGYVTSFVLGAVVVAATVLLASLAG
jgi:NADH-quinone oxidoreductase subunit L